MKQMLNGTKDLIQNKTDKNNGDLLSQMRKRKLLDKRMLFGKRKIERMRRYNKKK